ncbi:unnamed protein product [Phytomonas sp. Hart1]|nr:unnamed protein product [Phytomonas sp. Hart1]|eukprot:CCW69539.1 unnamed protein product [Phytomonas sp. isolate Hart1]
MSIQISIRYKGDSQVGDDQGISEESVVFDCGHDMQNFTETKGHLSLSLDEKPLNENRRGEDWFELLFYDFPECYDDKQGAGNELSAQNQSNSSGFTSVSEKEEEKKDIVTRDISMRESNVADENEDLFWCLRDTGNQVIMESTNTNQEIRRASFLYNELSTKGKESNLFENPLYTNRDANEGFEHHIDFKHQKFSARSHVSKRRHSSSLHHVDDYEALAIFHEMPRPLEGLFHDLEESTLQDWSLQSGYNTHSTQEKSDTWYEPEKQNESDPLEVSHLRRCNNVQLISKETQIPLKIPDKAEHIADEATAVVINEERYRTAQDTMGRPAAASTVPSSNTVVPTSPRMANRRSYLSQQDKLYLAPQPLAELRPDEGYSPAQPHMCVLVVFAANDLRVHDNYNLALASIYAHKAGGLPVVALCVLDYRTFAQPSLVGGFFRQSPQRAQFLISTIAALRTRLEDSDLHVPLLIRCGRPEEHVPRLVVELGAVDVFLTTQYAPHERRVHDYILQRIKKRCWVSRRVVENNDFGFVGMTKINDRGEGEELVEVVEHIERHPYLNTQSRTEPFSLNRHVAVHSVWQSTLVHLDDLQTPVAAMKEGERWYHDDVTTAVIRPTGPYEWHIAQLKDLPVIARLLPGERERLGLDPPSLLRGRLPTLEELGYDNVPHLFHFEEVIATQSSHPTAGEEAAIERVQDWLDQGGMTSMLRFAHVKRTNTKMYSPKLSRVSPYIATGALSPRKFYEMLRTHTHANLRDGFVQMQYREALLRLSRRDYWHWMGIRYGDRLFFPYGPHPEETDDISDWRHDGAIVQKWCMGLTGIPFTDAAMRELLGTGFVAHEGRQALVWLLTRGYGQDWRLAAEWLERCSLDFDPFVCYGNCAYFSELIHDDFGETVRNVHFLMHHHDQTGIYIKKWLPQLSKIPPVYIHRPHILTPRMQSMYGVYIGRNYPYPLKLWQGAHRALTSADLRAYFPDLQNLRGPGYAEAARHGTALMQPEEWNHIFDITFIRDQPWIRGSLLASAFDDVEDEESIGVDAYYARTKPTGMDKVFFTSESS